MPTARYRIVTLLTDNIVLRVIAYYVLLLGGITLLWPWLPEALQHALLSAFAPLMLPGGPVSSGAVPGRGAEELAAAILDMRPRTESVAFHAAGASMAAFALALPVSWVYMMTRERRGYRQSVVHTLVLLPMVVAGVVVLVKNSLALAFSLAGIVAAVRFRNTLDDSKDAVFLFLVTGLGLACGVELEVGLVTSVLFNAATLILFYTDFARMPPALEGERARRQLDRALAVANRTSMFVARVDDEVLASLGPEQLDALAQRVRRRREDITPELPTVPQLEFDCRLRVVTTDAATARPLLEPVLMRDTKKWVLEKIDTNDGHDVIYWHVRWRRGVTPAMVLEDIRRDGGDVVVHAEIG